jgi:hypothetical protein
MQTTVKITGSQALAPPEEADDSGQNRASKFDLPPGLEALIISAS